jgi:MOSC domain-containing protein YiiM
LGTAVVEITAMPHNGCKKFSERFGKDAVKFFNNEEGKRLRMRGVFARVIEPGVVRTGDEVR